MSIKANFTPAQVAAALQKRVAAIESEIVRTLSKEGEQFVKNARNNHGYTDQTGNLTSSIGYVLLKDGRQLTGSGFDIVKSGSEGSKIGKQTAATAAAKHNKGYVLIVVAGMDYASAVESGIRRKPGENGDWYAIQQYDVIRKSSIQAELDIKKALEKLAAKITR